MGILSNPTQFAQSKASGPEVLKKKKLSIPVDLLRARRKTSEILTNQKAAIYVQRIYSHSICSVQILKLGKQSQVSFPDYIFQFEPSLSRPLSSFLFLIQYLSTNCLFSQLVLKRTKGQLSAIVNLGILCN